MPSSPTHSRSAFPHTVPSPSPLRNASTASNGSSSQYSSSDVPSRASTVSSRGLPDIYNGIKGHRRGYSESTADATTNAAGTYLAIRSKLRPPPQASASPKTSPKKSPTQTHARAKSLASVDPPSAVADTAHLRAERQSPNAATRHLPSSHDNAPARPHNRSKSLDPYSAAHLGGPAAHIGLDGSAPPTNSYSMALSRSDSVRPHARERPQSIHYGHSSLDRPDLQGLAKSSTAHLRTLSKFGANGDDEFSIKSPEQEVVGMHGRRRLQRGMSTREKRAQTGWAARTWMDQQRQFLQAYEYLCHIGEAKEWIEDVIDKPIPAIVQLEEALRDGVTLAEIVQALEPQRQIKIFRHAKLQFRHSDNIALFFRLLHDYELPELFHFELVDLYEKKNIPKVIYCIHALSWLLYRKGYRDQPIGNLVGQLEFEHHELEEMQKGLDKSGVSMPNFSSMGANFGAPEPEPEPEESEEERIRRCLEDNIHIIIDLQSQIRGALTRERLGDDLKGLWDSEDWFVDLQSRVRGEMARQVFRYKREMQRFAVNLQSAIRGFVVRKRQNTAQQCWHRSEGQIVTLQSLVRAQKARADFRHIRTRAQQHESGIKMLQAAIRGAWKRREIGDQYEAVHEAAVEVTRLQAAIRGALSRKRVTHLHAQLHTTEPVIQTLQSAVRGARVRSELNHQRTATQAAGKGVERLQAMARGMLLRTARRAEHDRLRQHEPTIAQLQGAIRAMSVRVDMAKMASDLSSHQSRWIDLQAAVRARILRCSVSKQRADLAAHLPMIVELQSLVRGRVLRCSMDKLQKELHLCTSGTVALQSAARGATTRSQVQKKLDALAREEGPTTDLQSRIRGWSVRKSHEAQLDALADAASSITELQSAVRGYVSRDNTYNLLCALRDNEEAIVEFQSCARAMLARATIGHIFLQLELEDDVICELQSLARGMIVRTRFKEKQRFYKENMDKVIKIQSFIRGRQQGEAYKSLTSGNNPPVSTVKNFVHLLNDSDIDFDEEIEFEGLRQTVVQHIRQNEMAEQYIDQLDIKIALLVRNKITLDEIVKHQKHFGGNVGSLLTNKELASKDPFDLTALNRNSRNKLEQYQELFSILQTQPQYLARLFTKLRDHGMVEQESKRAELLIMGVFGFAQKRREEYYLLKLISRSIKEEADMCDSIQDYIRGSYFWSKIVANYVRTPRDRKYLRELLGPLIKDSIMSNEQLDLESDPLKIHQSIMNNEVLSTGQLSGPADLSQEEAIKDPEIRDIFISRLQELRDITEQFFYSMDKHVRRMPYGMRFIAQQQYEILCAKFPEEEPQYILKLCGHWLWRTYLQPALVQPESWGVIDRGLSRLQKKNLGEVTKVIGQIVASRQFGNDNLYLQPLNSFVTEMLHRVGGIWEDLISIQPAESEFDYGEFNDLYSTQKPTLYIKLPDISAIHQHVASELPSICVDAEDKYLSDLLRELGSAKGNEHELSGMNATEIRLTLSPKFRENKEQDHEHGIKSLYMETKRWILYIIRIQTGPDLLSIMIEPVREEDEDRWAALVREEVLSNGNKQPAYTDTNSPLVNIADLTYTQLKRIALENILKLEKAKRITRDNKYQDILNEIAIDIRTKHRRRIQRSREMENTRATLAALDSKSQWLDSQLKSYNDYIEQAMITLQSKKSKRRFLLPFTRQYNHERELQKRGQVPTFGSFKYSARALVEKGVLVEWQGYTEEKANITISSDQVGVFVIEGSVGSMMVPGASAIIPLDDLLQAQFENKQFIYLFEANDATAGPGSLKLNLNLLLHLVFKKFYRDGGT